MMIRPTGGAAFPSGQLYYPLQYSDDCACSPKWEIWCQTMGPPEYTPGPSVWGTRNWSS